MTPGEVAVSFLEDIRGASLSVDEVLGKSMLSPFCGEARREWIGKQLRELRGTLREDEVDLKVIGEKKEGGFAGVLVAVVPKGDPFTSSVIPVALRSLEERWVPAPVLGSFANANVGFDDGVRARVNGVGAVDGEAAGDPDAGYVFGCGERRWRSGWKEWLMRSC